MYVDSMYIGPALITMFNVRFFLIYSVKLIEANQSLICRHGLPSPETKTLALIHLNLFKMSLEKRQI
jgi:hypothetical protein